MARLSSSQAVSRAVTGAVSDRPEGQGDARTSSAPASTSARRVHAPGSYAPTRAEPTSHSVIFDVEGTLIDCANQITESWLHVLQDAGRDFSHAELHRYSGMDFDDMLAVLLPGTGKDETARLKRDHRVFYHEHFLPEIKAFPGVRGVFEQLRAAGHGLGLATTCDSEELTAYLDLAGVGDLVDAIACGDDRAPGKPHPDLYKLAVARVGARKNATAVGDTPYDAISACRAGIQAIGTLGGGFTERELKDGGCRDVVSELPELIALFAPV